MEINNNDDKKVSIIFIFMFLGLADFGRSLVKQTQISEFFYTYPNNNKKSD